MKCVVILVAIFLLMEFGKGRNIEETKFRLLRASMRVAKKLCKQKSNSKENVCKEFMSLLHTVTHNKTADAGTGGGQTTGDEGGIETMGLFGNPGLSWGG